MIQKTPEIQALKSFVEKTIKMKNITITNSSRHCYHIRFQLSGSIEEFNTFFNPIGIQVSNSNYSCSSKSPTYILESTKEIENIPKHTKLYWVNNEISNSKTGSKLFATKDLSPDNLNISGKSYTSNDLILKVSEELEKKYDSCISSQLIELLKSTSSKNTNIRLKKVLDFSKDDLIVISKDFGEILSAIWIINNLNFTKVYFPNNSNEKMIDFYAEKISIRYPVSVKSGQGGKVLLQNIIDALNRRNKKLKRNIKEEPIYKVIKIVNDNSAKEQMILIHQYLQTKMIKDISIILDKPKDEINLEYIKEWANSKTIQELKDILSKWWEEHSKPIKLEVKDQERMIISPLGESIKNILNKDDKLKESLNFLAKQVALLQINIDVEPNKIVFKKSFFKDSQFEFGWPGYSSGNKLGFRMI